MRQYNYKHHPVTKFEHGIHEVCKRRITEMTIIILVLNQTVTLSSVE